MPSEQQTVWTPHEFFERRRARALTTRQRLWLEAFKWLVLANDGVPPTVRELTRHMNRTSSAAAQHMLMVLVARGYVRQLPGRRGYWPLSYRALYAKEPVRV